MGHDHGRCYKSKKLLTNGELKMPLKILCLCFIYYATDYPNSNGKTRFKKSKSVRTHYLSRIVL